MAELPASWKLKTKKRADGRLDVIGKDDIGNEYKVRTCEAGAVTESDVEAIREADREQYRDTSDAARKYIKSALDASEAYKRNQENAFFDDITEAAGPVVHAGLERGGSTSRFSRKYIENFDSVFGG